jgi:phage gpG-like protein
MLNITFEIDGQIEVDRTFTRFTEQLRDFRQLWPAVITELRKITLQQFAYEGAGATGQWRALSTGYAKWKQKHYPDSLILQRTGAMQLSLTGNTAHSIVRAGKTELEFGTNLHYAIYHQQRARAGRLPRRPIFDFTEAHRTQITKAIQVRLVKAGRDNGVTVS